MFDHTDICTGPTDGLFFALPVPASVTPTIVVLAQRLRSANELTGTLIAPECLHISLLAFGRYWGLPARLVELAKEAGAQVRVPAFACVFDRSMSFRNADAHPFVLRAVMGPTSSRPCGGH